MNQTKTCPKCAQTLNFLASACSQCSYIFKERELCQHCMGAYPLNKLTLVEEKIICEICFKKRTDIQKEKALHTKHPKSSRQKSVFPAVLIPFLGFFWIQGVVARSTKNTSYPPKKYTKALLFNLFWTLFFCYLGAEFYLFQNKMSPQKQVQIYIQEITQAQEAFKKENKRYTMFENLIQKKYLPWTFEITNRKVLVEKEGYEFQIYVASNDLWQMKIIPKSPNSLKLRYYIDQKGIIRYNYFQEADENSPPLPLTLSFVDHLRQHSWVARFYHYLIA